MAARQAFSGKIIDGSYQVEMPAGKAKIEVRASRIIPGKFDNSNATPEPVGEM